MSKPVLLAYPSLGAFEGLFGAHFEIASWPLTIDPTQVEAVAAIGSIGLPAEVYQLANLKIISCFGVGYDKIDLAAARARGIPVTNCPDVNAEDVADVAMALILSACRNLSTAERVLRAGQWSGPLAIPPPRRLRGRKLGIVGLGAIGRGLAKRAEAFGLDIAWTGPRPKPDAPWRFVADVKTLARECDILALCLRPDPGTEHMIDAEILSLLGSDGVVINVSRGSVVDEDALIAALKNGTLGAAGLDVFAQEPAPAERWRDVPNITLYPHIAGGTRDGIMEMAHLVLRNLQAGVAGQAPITPIV
jgi:lactate dehydrogenase-like 2-hydroxyacid dehydrogenase